MEIIDHLFDLLDEWRHLPAYQLERRADVFFAIYLPQILSVKYNLTQVSIIPEFPIRIGEISNYDINKSFKVDYFVFDPMTPKIYFIELKTDDSSTRDKQDWYLIEAKSVGVKILIDGIIKIFNASTYKEKYLVLLTKLKELGFLEYRNDKPVNVLKNEYEIEIIYILPNDSQKHSNIITFDEIALFIEKNNDDLSIRFAKSLREWASIKAGRKQLIDY